MTFLFHFHKLCYIQKELISYEVPHDKELEPVRPVEPVGSKIFGPGRGPDKLKILDPDPTGPDFRQLVMTNFRLYLRISPSINDLIHCF